LMLPCLALPGLLRSLVTSIIASIASLVLSFVTWELGRLNTSIYSLRRYHFDASIPRFDASMPRASRLASIFGHFDNSFDR
jgi:hypothetical protein